ncbi:MAG: hypothetical protein MJE66_16125 [Proteobacteria bacterium]|nr:hypothetical protein [Pseudomonadota bacterium]
MRLRRPLSALAATAALCTVGAMGSCPKPLVEERLSVPGFQEPNTPGAPGVAVSDKLRRLLGEEVDLNQVTYVRTALPKPSGAPPRIILIHIPGFLGGATNFTPYAQQLVRAFAGNLEVWAVDRRPNQLEDRRGALHATAGDPDSILEGTQFYFPDEDRPGDDNDVDVNGNGIIDPPFALPNALGDDEAFIALEQDDLRFLAHWGIDTYARDWKILVERARDVVGENGLVVFGGHSMGTSWTAAFAGYDFDPGPGVLAGYELVDGLILYEGGGLGPGSASPPTLTEYQDRVAALASDGGPDVYLATLFGLLSVVDLGNASELIGIAGTFDPTAPAVVQNTTFGDTLGLFIQAPTTNQSAVGFFLDDDFSINPAFRASMGFSDDGVNNFNGGLDAYIAVGAGAPRQWRNFDDPALPSCPPAVFDVSPGCALIDNGPQPAPGEAPRVWGVEAEVTDIDDILRLTYTNGNFSEWYFVDGRVNLDFGYGRDGAAALGDESLLALTQTANVDVPVLAIGGSNGLTPTPESFASYLGAIATPDEDKEIVIAEGYAHLDVLTAADNSVLPAVTDWLNRLLQRKLLGSL